MNTNQYPISRLGFGLYNGSETDETDEALLGVMRLALERGIRSFDCAPCYRNLRSENLLGKIVSENPSVRLFISTKGGFVPFDFSKGMEAEKKFIDNLIRRGLIRDHLFDHRYFQCFDPIYLEFRLNETLRILGVHSVDVYYIHNPEYLLSRFGKDSFLAIMDGVFKWLKGHIEKGKIKAIGVASWTGFYNKEFSHCLQVGDFIELAVSHDIVSFFKYIQVPYNLSNTDGIAKKTQLLNGELKSLFRACHESNISVITSAPLNQGRLVHYPIPSKMRLMVGDMSNVGICLNFIFSSPGVSGVLVSTSSKKHLKEVLEIADNSRNIFRQITGKE